MGDRTERRGEEGSGASPGADGGAWGGWMRYGRIYWALWKNSVVREMQFKVNFLLWIVVETLWFALQLTFMAVLYSHTESVGGWTKWQVVLLTGCNYVIQQLFIAFFMTNVAGLSELIRTGKLDLMLLLPVNTRFLVTLRAVDLGGLVNAVTGLAVIVYALVQLGVRPGIGAVGVFAGLVALGAAIHYSLLLMLACVSFWSVKAQGVVYGYYNLFNIARLPDSVFRGWFRAVFTFVVPILLVSSVPAKVVGDFLGSPRELVWFGVMAVAMFGASEGLWRHSIRRYTSASS